MSISIGKRILPGLGAIVARDLARRIDGSTPSSGSVRATMPNAVRRAK